MRSASPARRNALKRHGWASAPVWSLRKNNMKIGSCSGVTRPVWKQANAISGLIADALLSLDPIEGMEQVAPEYGMASVETGTETVPILGLRQRRQFRQSFVVETGDVGELQQGRPALGSCARPVAVVSRPLLSESMRRFRRFDGCTQRSATGLHDRLHYLVTRVARGTGGGSVTGGSRRMTLGAGHLQL